MHLPAFHHPLSKAAVVTVALPLYIVGSVSWIIAAYGTMVDAMVPSDWPVRQVVEMVLILGTLPLAILLFCTIATAYFPWRMGLTLLTPIPIFIVGVIFTPGNGAPFHLIGAALASLFLVIMLLQYWAHRDPLKH